jgi:hypothetical protein
MLMFQLRLKVVALLRHRFNRHAILELLLPVLTLHIFQLLRLCMIALLVKLEEFVDLCLVKMLNLLLIEFLVSSTLLLDILDQLQSIVLLRFFMQQQLI